MGSPENAKIHDRRLYALLHVTEEDLRQAWFFAAHILKKGWHYEPWEKRWSVYMQQTAYTTALVTAYSRPFTESRGRSKFPKRLLSAFNPKQQQLHDRILSLRNLIYAHSEVGSRAIHPISLDGYPTAIEFLPAMRLTREEITELQTMISAVRASIKVRKMELIEAVSREA